MACSEMISLPQRLLMVVLFRTLLGKTSIFMKTLSTKNHPILWQR